MEILGGEVKLNSNTGKWGYVIFMGENEEILLESEYKFFTQMDAEQEFLVIL